MICTCAAHGPSECVCGAWDDSWKRYCNTCRFLGHHQDYYENTVNWCKCLHQEVPEDFGCTFHKYKEN